mgnify:CR=1 FL=1
MLILLLVDLLKRLKWRFCQRVETAYADIKDTLSSSAQGTVEAIKKPNTKSTNIKQLISC